MATRVKAEQAHAFNERDFARAANSIQFTEAFLRGPPRQRARWPIEGSLPGNRFGILTTQLTACSLNPAIVHEWDLSFNPQTGAIASDAPLFESDGTPITFKAIDSHGVTLPVGRWVSCIYRAGDIWAVVAAHCSGSCNNVIVIPPPSECTGPGPICPINQQAVCVNGEWVCQDATPGPGCSGTPPTCIDGNPAECVNGTWECANNPCGTLGSLCSECGPPDCSGVGDPENPWQPCCEGGFWNCCPPGGAGGGGGGGGGGVSLPPPP